MISVTRKRPAGALNEYSGTIEPTDWQNASEASFYAFGVSPENNRELSRVDRVEADRFFIVYFLEKMPDIIASDRLVISGQVFEVVQKPEEWHNPFSPNHSFIGCTVSVKMLGGL